MEGENTDGEQQSRTDALYFQSCILGKYYLYFG
jgi:hypothetical protein